MHPSKTSLRFWAAWSFLRCGIGCWLEADHVHVLILHYAVIQLHGTAVPRQEPQDQEGRVHCPARELETPWHLARARAGHGTGDPLSIARAGARLRARVGRIQVSIQARQSKPRAGRVAFSFSRSHRSTRTTTRNFQTLAVAGAHIHGTRRPPGRPPLAPARLQRSPNRLCRPRSPQKPRSPRGPYQPAPSRSSGLATITRR